MGVELEEYRESGSLTSKVSGLWVPCSFAAVDVTDRTDLDRSRTTALLSSESVGGWHLSHAESVEDASAAGNERQAGQRDEQRRYELRPKGGIRVAPLDERRASMRTASARRRLQDGPN